jgi:hypothetical protein
VHSSLELPISFKQNIFVMHPCNVNRSLRKDEPAYTSPNSCPEHRVTKDKPQTATEICTCTASGQTNPGLPMAVCTWICLPPSQAPLLR